MGVGIYAEATSVILMSKQRILTESWPGLIPVNAYGIMLRDKLVYDYESGKKEYHYTCRSGKWENRLKLVDYTMNEKSQQGGEK